MQNDNEEFRLVTLTMGAFFPFRKLGCQVRKHVKVDKTQNPINKVTLRATNITFVFILILQKLDQM